MYPEISLGPFTVHTFGLMMALAFVAAGIVAYFEFRRKGLDPEKIYWLVIASALGGLIGAKVNYLLLNLDQVKADPLSTIFSGAGLVWYGGLIGGLLAALLVMRLYRLPWAKVLDAGAPAMAIGYAFGRMGCFLNGDDYGRPSTLPWAVQFPKGSPPTPSGVSVQPTELYEAFSSLVILAIVLWLRPRLKRDWAMICLYLTLAGFERFMVEFVRFHNGEMPGVTRQGQLQQQLLGLATAVVAGIAFLWVQLRKQRQPELEEAERAPVTKPATDAS